MSPFVEMYFVIEYLEMTQKQDGGSNGCHGIATLYGSNARCHSNIIRQYSSAGYLYIMYRDGYVGWCNVLRLLS